METFLDGRVKARQPETGFRSGTDAVLLAAAVPGKAGDVALELGAGAGTASLCLAARVPGMDLTGVEIDSARCDTRRPTNACRRVSLMTIITAITWPGRDEGRAAWSYRTGCPTAWK